MCSTHTNCSKVFFSVVHSLTNPNIQIKASLIHKCTEHENQYALEPFFAYAEGLTYNALVLPHLDYCSVVWQECSKELRQKIERVQNYGMRLILSKPPRTPSAGLREELQWLTLEKRREMSWMTLVHRCATKRAPPCLATRLRTNARMGNRVTRGYDKLFVPQAVNTGYFRKSLTFEGYDKVLPSEMKSLNASLVFKRQLRTRLLKA